MFKRILKWFFSIVLLAVIALAIFLINLIWFRPWSLNLFYEKLSTHVLDWFIKDQVEGEKWQWHNYPVNQLFGVQNQYPSFMANTHRLLSPKDCEYYIMRLDALPKKFDQTLEGLKVREQKQIL